MTIAVYQKGDLKRFAATFKNSSGTPTDPSAVTFKYTKPSGTTTTLTYSVDVALVKDSTGVYHVDLSLSEKGRWYYQWKGTGAVEEVEEGEFEVFSGAF